MSITDDSDSTIKNSLYICAFCNTTEKERGFSFKKCGNCKEVVYCGAECQRKHWPIHKIPCKNKSTSIKKEENNHQKTIIRDEKDNMSTETMVTSIAQDEVDTHTITPIDGPVRLEHLVKALSQLGVNPVSSNSSVLPKVGRAAEYRLLGHGAPHHKSSPSPEITTTPSLPAPLWAELESEQMQRALEESKKLEVEESKSRAEEEQKNIEKAEIEMESIKEFYHNQTKKIKSSNIRTAEMLTEEDFLSADSDDFYYDSVGDEDDDRFEFDSEEENEEDIDEDDEWGTL